MNNFEDWKRRQDRLAELYPGRKGENWKFDYVQAGGVLIILIVGMTACVVKHYGYFPLIF